MALTLKESQAATELADKLYPFLPGKPHPYADQNLSFPGVAASLGLARCWHAGSKGPAITRLLTATLERERGRFCPLIIAVIQHGMTYRMNKDPVSREEIEELNEIILKIGYKIPELHDTEFLSTLPEREKKSKTNDTESLDPQALADLQERFEEVQGLEPVKRGFAFESFLSELFRMFDLAPRRAFCLTGEQIDGSFELDSEVYLLEARWRNDPATNADLLAFAGKVSGKAQWSRGLFVSYAGFSDAGLQGFRQGRSTNLIGLEGLDLYHILHGTLDMRAVLRRKVRRAAETNRFFVPVRELFPNVT